MSLEIVANVDLRMDLDPHQTIDQYVKTLSFESIAKGFSEKDFRWRRHRASAGDDR